MGKILLLPGKLRDRMPRPAPPLIAHIVYGLDYGGLENGLVNLINGLPREAARHTVICLTRATDFRQRIRRPDVTVHELHKQPGKDPATYLRLWRLLRSLKPTVVHTRNAGVIDCQAVACLAGVPVRIHGWHGWDVDDLHGTSPRRRRLRQACDRFIHRHIAVSRQLADWLQQADGVSPDRVTHICNGVDIERFAPALKAPGPFVIGTVARLQAVKDQQTLLRAVALLMAGHPQLRDTLRLRLVGDGPERRALEALVLELGIGDVTAMPGFSDDVPAVLRSFDVFALPSLNEGISNTILEAMACGVPVIATNVGGNPELVLDGVTGSLIPVGDPATLSARLSQYATDPALLQAHGAAARHRVEQQFSIPTMLANYAELYRDMTSLKAAA
jgi:sugar transferase (PEP-CTERM/EpsH1 system associated)